MSAEENMPLARRFMETQIKGYLHEDKSRRHQPGGGNENKEKVFGYCDVSLQHDLIPRWPFHHLIKHALSLFHAPKSRTVLYVDPFASL